MSGTFGDTTEVSGRLVGEYGLVARQAIDAIAGELRRTFQADREHCPELVIPDQSTLRALAFVELCRRGLGVDLDSEQGASAGCDVGRERDDPQSRGDHP